MVNLFKGKFGEGSRRNHGGLRSLEEDSSKSKRSADDSQVPKSRMQSALIEKFASKLGMKISPTRTNSKGPSEKET